jgi:hypothetical protein
MGSFVSFGVPAFPFRSETPVELCSTGQPEGGCPHMSASEAAIQKKGRLAGVLLQAFTFTSRFRDLQIVGH